jgi:hypothetical protein
MKKISLVIILLSITSSLFSQTKFNKYFSSAQSLGILYRVIQTTDGGYAAIGHITDMSSFNDDFLIVKTDADGNLLWMKKIATPGSDDFTDIIETSGGGLAVVGSIFNTSTFLSQAIVVQFMSDGTKQWSKTYTVSGISSQAKKIQKDGSGSLYILGDVDVSGASTDYFIMKLDANGNIVQQNTFGTPDADFPLAFVRKANGEFYISGWDNSGNGENIHLLKINSSMSVVWNKLIAGTIKYFCYDMKEKSDGNLVLGGRYDDGTSSYDPMLLEVDPSSGNIVWAKSYSAFDGLPAYVYGIAVVTADEIAVTGIVEDTISGTLIFGTGSDGTLNWAERVSGSVGEYASGYGIGKAGNDGYILCGPRSGSNNSIVQLVKTGASGETFCNSFYYQLGALALTLPSQSVTVSAGTGTLAAADVSLEELTESETGDICLGTGIAPANDIAVMTVYPNPSNGRFTINLNRNLPDASLTIYNTFGKDVFFNPSLKGNDTGSGSSIELNLLPGTYLVQLNSKELHATKKIIIQ